MQQRSELVDRYVAVWNEPHAERRRAAVAELWTEDAVHLLQPPQEVRAAAAALSMGSVFAARGHAELEARVARAHAEFVALGEYRFRSGATAASVADAVTFDWEMTTAADEVAAVGREVVLLAPDGRIRIDYQFIVS